MNGDTKNNYSVFDTHCDTLCCVRDDGKSLNENDCHVDLKRMSEYKSYTQVFACFIDPIYKTCGAGANNEFNRYVPYAHAKFTAEC